jgi:hypothetical protein
VIVGFDVVNDRGISRWGNWIFYSTTSYKLLLLVSKSCIVEMPRAGRIILEVVQDVHMTRRMIMTESVYKVIELVGTSEESWEKAAANAVETAAKSLRDLRIAEVVELDMVIESGRVRAYRSKVKVSFKYQSGE